MKRLIALLLAAFFVAGMASACAPEMKDDKMMKEDSMKKEDTMKKDDMMKEDTMKK